jgi:negative regulator of sigma E activity
MEVKMENTIITSENENPVVEDTTTTEDVKTYTQEEVLQLIQSEADKRVSQALKTQQKKYEKQLSLSKLDGEEREKAEKDNRIAELEEQLKKFEIERSAEATALQGSIELARELEVISKTHSTANPSIKHVRENRKIEKTKENYGE